MTTLRQYSHLNFVVLQLAAKPEAAVTTDDLLRALTERRLFALLHAAGARSGVDTSAIRELVEPEVDIADALESWANVADLTRKYSDDLAPNSPLGWLALAFFINETIAQYGDVDATWGA
ncbi:hypothetical protein ACVLV4_002583 [Rathayibacter agropyri]